jgi:hypothetical protein
MLSCATTICWNYLYLSQKLAEIDDPAKREELLCDLEITQFYRTFLGDPGPEVSKPALKSTHKPRLKPEA